MRLRSGNRWRRCWKWKATTSSRPTAANEGLAQIGERSFDLVLLDLALPDHNGMELLAEIHARIRSLPSS